MNLIKKYWYLVIAPIILVVMFATMYFSTIGDSAIVDEIAHIPSGYSYITTGDYRLNPEHPPIIKDLAAIPLLFAHVTFPYDYWKSNSPVVNNQWQMGWKFLYETPSNNPDQMLTLAHIPMMLLSIVLGVLVFIWSKKLFGPKAAIMGLLLYAFDANIIAHSRFVTTDMGISLAVFLNMFTLYYYLKKPSWKRLAFTAATFFFALVAKFSAAILAPAYGIVFLMLIFRKGTEKETNILDGIFNKKWGKRFVSAFLAFAIFCIAGVLMMWTFYFFHTMNMPAQVQKDLITESLPNNVFSSSLLKMSDNPVLKPFGQYLLGFFMVSGHVEGGHDAFLLGQTSNQGWWYYYPVVIAVKTALPIFFILLLLFVFRKKLQWKDWFTELYFWIIPAVLLVMGMQGKINLGVRYMLPIYAFIYVYLSRTGDLVDLKNLFDAKKKDMQMLWASIIVGLLVIWYIIGSLSTFPSYLSYFNDAANAYTGGSTYKLLTDSNLDWGQDVKRLANWIKNSDLSKEHNCQYQTYVDVFPGSMPAAYYIGRDRMIEWHVQNGKPSGCFAISATFYQNSKGKKAANNGMDYTWLDSKTPITSIGGHGGSNGAGDKGGSILIYDLKKQ